VRRLIFECFRHKSTDTNCEDCATNAKYELAFCYYVGFGTRRNIELAQHWVSQCGRTLECLEDETDEVVDFDSNRNKRMAQFGLNGFDMIMDHVNEYRKSNYNTDSVLEDYKREILDLTSSFQQQPLVTAGLRATLAAILASSGNSRDAIHEYKKLIEFFDNSAEHGPNHASSLSLRCRLADLLRLEGNIHEAESVIRSVLKIKNTTYDEADATGLENCATLGAIIFDAERYEEALEIFRAVREATARLLGTEHVQTLIAMANLACAYRELGMLEEAEELDLAVLERKKIFIDEKGGHHYTYITSMANLALTYTRQNRWDEARKLELAVIQERTKQLGSDHPSTLIAYKNLAYTYFEQDKFREAKDMFEMVISGQESRLGATHPQTLNSLESLANVYFKQGRMVEGKKILMSSLPAVLGNHEYRHPLTKRYLNACEKAKMEP
jgi:tetratricopeptide (TPR) repeat protein